MIIVDAFMCVCACACMYVYVRLYACMIESMNERVCACVRLCVFLHVSIDALAWLEASATSHHAFSQSAESAGAVLSLLYVGKYLCYELE